MPYIGRAATNAGSVNYLDDISSGFDGNDVTFTCAVKGTTITPGQENVYLYLDGVFQHPGDSYTISGSTITFTEAPVSGADFTGYVAGEGAYLDDGTVSTVKLDDDAVTASKLDDDGTGFQVGDLGVGGSLTSGDKLTVTGRLRASGGILGDLTGDVTGDLTGNVTGNVTGNTSGTAATVTGAAQSAITSLGTLTSLTVDNININSNNISSTNSDGDILFKGNDGGSTITALTLDMSESGAATFNNWVYVDNRVMSASGDIRVGSNDGNEMLHLLANGTAKIDTAGTTALTIDSSQNATFAGDVTINTSSHSTLLIKGADSCDAEIALQSDNADDNTDKWSINAKHSAGGTLHFATYGSGSWTNPLILSHTSATFSGVILGADGSNSAPMYSFSGDTNTGMYRGAADTLRFATGGAERIEVTSSQTKVTGNLVNVGYAETRITSNNTGHDFKFNADTGFVNSIDSNFDGASAGSSYMRFKVASGANSQTTVMDLKGDGKVGIGTSSPSHLLEISQDASSYPVLIKQNQGDGLCLDVFASASDQASNDAIIRARTNHATLLQLMNDGRMIVQQNHIQVAGAVIPGTANEADNNKIFTGSSGSGSTNMFIGNAQIQVSSDKRLKTNIRDTEMNPIETLNKLRIVDFDWDDPNDISWNNKMARVENGGQWSGILAQEAVKVVPHIINAPRIKETLELDHKSKNTWQVEYEHLVPTLVKAVQELSQKVEELQKKCENCC